MTPLYRYITGFALSLVLTLVAVLALVLGELGVGPTFSTLQLALIFVALALMQFVVQLNFFMHLGSKAERENVAVFGLTLVIVFILVGGTLWIMQNLEVHHEIPEMFENNVIAPHTQLD